jgi:hypothetical protein
LNRPIAGSSLGGGVEIAKTAVEVKITQVWRNTGKKASEAV